jgi:hypothetical protein
VHSREGPIDYLFGNKLTVRNDQLRFVIESDNAGANADTPDNASLITNLDQVANLDGPFEKKNQAAAARSRVVLSIVLLEENSVWSSFILSKAESEPATISGNGTAVGAGAAVGEGDGLTEGDGFCACAANANHATSRLTAADALRIASLFILSAQLRK